MESKLSHLGREPLYFHRLGRAKAQANLVELDLFNALDSAVAAVSRIEIQAQRYYGNGDDLGANGARSMLQESAELVLVQKIEKRLHAERIAQSDGGRVV